MKVRAEVGKRTRSLTEKLRNHEARELVKSFKCIFKSQRITKGGC